VRSLEARARTSSPSARASSGTRPGKAERTVR
jgi:hypothetical protein